jgi:hypothetical protein
VLTVRLPLALAVLLAALVAWLTSAGPAAAGGPTSALLSVPGEGQTASLYYTDPEYDALAGLVGITGDQGNVDRSRQGHENGPGVTVTWLIHDVAPWRVDHIYLAGPGAPWIATQVLGDGGDIWDSPVVWHQPASPAALGRLLDRLGVGAAARAAGEFQGVAGAPVPEPAEEAPEPAEAAGSDAPAPAAPAGSSAATGPVWGLAGLLGGVLLTLLWRRASRTEEPEAVARTDDPDDEPTDAALVVGEGLAWPESRLR